MEKRRIWTEHLSYVEEHNNRADVNFRLEMNDFADQQFPIERVPLISTESEQVWNVFQELPGPSENNPDNFDWRKRGVVPQVKNQGQLSSAFAIAAADCVESFNAISTAHLISLSSQEVADCCSSADSVFDCIHGLGGLCSEMAYPAGGKHTCRNNTCTPAVQIRGSKSVPIGREDIMETDLLLNPIMVLVDASHSSFMLYKSGIYSDPSCSSSLLDHALLLVGYGREAGKMYWICQNSWGASWGLNGYIWIEAGNNMCGIATAASYPY